MLHTVNKSPFEKDSLQTCLRLSRPGSRVLMIEDAVYGALKGSEMESSVLDSLQDRKIYALGPDLKARGIGNESIIDGIQIIDYKVFVGLAAESSKVQSWL